MNVLPAPDLSDSAILRVVAGIRPCRRTGVRLESEQLTLGARTKTVIHNYGHGGCGVTTSFGCAQLAADLVEASSSPPPPPRGTGVPPVISSPSFLPPIAILGAGVIALSTARELLSRAYQVTCYASAFAEHTTSNIAGALWLPTGIEFGSTHEAVARFQDILQRSKRAFSELDRERWGVERIPVYTPAYAAHEERFFNNATIDPPELLERLPLPGPPRAGRVFYTDFIHTPRFMRALVDDVSARGGALVERTFNSRDDLGRLDEPILVNCLALGARDLFDDHDLYPARGVLVHMKPQPLGYAIDDGYRYMFPREDALILGGCFDAGVDDPDPPEHIAQEILAHHRRFFGVS